MSQWLHFFAFDVLYTLNPLSRTNQVCLLTKLFSATIQKFEYIPYYYFGHNLENSIKNTPIIHREGNLKL